MYVVGKASTTWWRPIAVTATSEECLDRPRLVPGAPRQLFNGLRPNIVARSGVFGARVTEPDDEPVSCQGGRVVEI